MIHTQLTLIVGFAEHCQTVAPFLRTMTLSVRTMGEDNKVPLIEKILDAS